METDKQNEGIVPEIKLECPNCKSGFSIEAIHRIYRIYISLTRNSRAKSYKAVCSLCGKHTQVRVPPLHADNYQCRRCKFQKEVETKYNYKPNPIASKRL